MEAMTSRVISAVSPCFIMLRERRRQVAGRAGRAAVVWAENVSPLLEHSPTECLRFCVLSQLEQREDELVLCSERAPIVCPERVSLDGERRPQQHCRLRALSEAQKRDEAQISLLPCSGIGLCTCVRASMTPRISRAVHACFPAAPSAPAYVPVAARPLVGLHHVRVVRPCAARSRAAV